MDSLESGGMHVMWSMYNSSRCFVLILVCVINVLVLQPVDEVPCVFTNFSWYFNPPFTLVPYFPFQGQNNLKCISFLWFFLFFFWWKCFVFFLVDTWQHICMNALMWRVYWPWLFDGASTFSFVNLISIIPPIFNLQIKVAKTCKIYKY